MKFGKHKTKVFAITIGWAILLSGIILWAFYTGHSYDIYALSTYGPSLMLEDLVLLFVFSVFGGLVLVDMETVVFSSFGVLGLSIVIVLFCINLPSILGVITYWVWSQYLLNAALTFVVRSFMLCSVICIMGALLGGFLGERMHIRD